MKNSCDVKKNHEIIILLKIPRIRRNADATFTKRKDFLKLSTKPHLFNQEHLLVELTLLSFVILTKVCLVNNQKNSKCSFGYDNQADNG